MSFSSNPEEDYGSSATIHSTKARVPGTGPAEDRGLQKSEGNLRGRVTVKQQLESRIVNTQKREAFQIMY